MSIVDLDSPAGSQPFSVTDAFSRRWAGLRWGTGELQVVALHGWLDNAASFTELAPLLKDCTVHAFDFLGHGHSDRIEYVHGYRFVDSVFDVLALLDALDLTEPIVLGHSMGAALASMAMAVDATAAKALVCLEGFGPLSGEVSDALKRMRSYKKRFFKRIHEGGSHQHAGKRHPDFEALLQARATATPDVHPDRLRALVHRAAERDESGWFWRADPKLLEPSPYRMTEEQAQAVLAGIELPTLFLLADNGLLAELSYLDSRRGLNSWISSEVLAGGHHFHLEHAQSVAEPILRFFRAHI